MVAGEAVVNVGLPGILALTAIIPIMNQDM